MRAHSDAQLCTRGQSLLMVLFGNTSLVPRIHGLIRNVEKVPLRLRVQVHELKLSRLSVCLEFPGVSNARAAIASGPRSPPRNG